MSAERRFPATARRREQARRDGRVARSGVATGAAVLVTGALSLFAGGVWGIERLAVFTASTVERAFVEPRIYDVLTAAFSLLGELCAPVLLAAFGGAALVSFVQVGGLFTVRPIVPDAARLRLQRPQGPPAWWDVCRGVALFFAAVIALRVSVGVLLRVSRETLPDAVGAIVQTIGVVMPAVLFVVVCLGALDWLRVRAEWERGLRMTRQEREDERRQMEGNPEVKSHVLRHRSRGRAPAEGTERDATAGMRAPAREIEPGD